MKYLAVFPPLYFRRMKGSVERKGKTDIVPVKVFCVIFWYDLRVSLVIH